MFTLFTGSQPTKNSFLIRVVDCRGSPSSPIKIDQSLAKHSYGMQPSLFNRLTRFLNGLTFIVSHLFSFTIGNALLPSTRNSHCQSIVIDPGARPTQRKSIKYFRMHFMYELSSMHLQSLLLRATKSTLPRTTVATGRRQSFQSLTTNILESS